MSGQTDIDRDNPGPQTVYDGRAYEATIRVLVKVDATEDQIAKWLEYEIGGGSISLDNPLVDEEITLDRLTDLRSLGYRCFTDWGHAEGDGARHGRMRIERE